MQDTQPDQARSGLLGGYRRAVIGHERPGQAALHQGL